MNLNFIKVGILLLSASAMFACKDDKTPVPGPGPGPGGTDGSIKLNNYLMAVDGRESIRPFSLSATQPWAVDLTEEQKQWIEVTPASGEGDYKATKISVRLKENAISKLPRETQLSFRLTNPGLGDTVLLKVTQGTEYFMKIDSLGVLAFYHATDGPNWTKPWDLNLPIDQWYFLGQGNMGADKKYRNGVYIKKDNTGSRRIDRLAWFENIGMHGKMPEEMKQLNAMAMFELCGFKLEGQTFDEFMGVLYNWPDLRNMWLDGCVMGGAKIPAELANFKLFNHFNFNRHDFVGFADNFGSIEFPVMEGLTVTEGPLKGEIKASYFDKMPKIAGIFLQDNELSGTLPGEIINGKPQLYLLQVNGNYLSGDFPINIRNSVLWTNMGGDGGDTEAAEYFCAQRGEGFTPGTCL